MLDRARCVRRLGVPGSRKSALLSVNNRPLQCLCHYSRREQTSCGPRQLPEQPHARVHAHNAHDAD